MSSRIPITAGRDRPANLAVLMREAFVALNDLVVPGWPSADTATSAPPTARSSNTSTTPARP